MPEITSTAEFREWLAGLKDHEARGKVLSRIKQMQLGSNGDWKAVGGSVLESRINSGPGYRIYFVAKGSLLIVLLGGGDKSSQSGDIARAIRLAENV